MPDGTQVDVICAQPTARPAPPLSQKMQRLPGGRVAQSCDHSGCDCCNPHCGNAMPRYFWMTPLYTTGCFLAFWLCDHVVRSIEGWTICEICILPPMTAAMV